jgi:hypothetical protein
MAERTDFKADVAGRCVLPLNYKISKSKFNITKK